MPEIDMSEVKETREPKCITHTPRCSTCRAKLVEVEYKDGDVAWACPHGHENRLIHAMEE